MTCKDTKISIIIPVYQEAEGIQKLIKDLLGRTQSAELEIIVVDGGPQKETLQAIREARVVKLPSPPGRARQMNKGAQWAKGRILLFLHADTILPPNALSLIRLTLASSRYSAGAFDLELDTANKYLQLFARIASTRSRLTRVPYGDQAIFMHKDYFFEIGKFKDIPIMEDLELMQRIKRRGDAIRIIAPPVLSSARRWEREGIFKGTARNWSLRILYHLGYPVHKLAKLYKPNK